MHTVFEFIMMDNFQKELNRFAKAGSTSKRPAHRLKQLNEENYIEINPTQRHPV